MTRGLTDIQKKILEYIIASRAERGVPPSLAEIAEHFGYKNRATARQHLQALEKKGMIKREEKISRGIQLTMQEKFFIPRPVLGEVAAGNPLTVYQDAVDTIDLPAIAHFPADSFLLRVKGDSLKDAYIFSGDVVIVNPNRLPVNGQFVVAVLDDGVLVKRFFQRAGTIELISENPDYKPIHIPGDHPRFRVIGLVTGIYRQLSVSN